MEESENYNKVNNPRRPRDQIKHDIHSYSPDEGEKKRFNTFYKPRNRINLNPGSKFIYQIYY